ncbi:hypothetical protein N7509_006059 [Penicillium cosmopolitanum]|uniref:DUF3533 domain-containing protein n=1 Tax=Penicillium cosmopolitanum TaxID=1131564 RepID=A0A9W9W3U1_9EURO|nr:uncharacterized protein N7509_006059 [Penicillium cosmopolitanum]KAJ5397946.1 hypothetical protein N7509_006059 [Penicillium cosmopolitanum]
MKLGKFYPRARQQRPSIHDPAVRPRRLALLKAAIINLLLLQFLFLGLFCYLFGSLFQQTGHIHNINILFVDYDGGAIGNAVRSAYTQLASTGFPTLIERPALFYPDPSSVVGAVCDIDYWAALYVTPNASNLLSAAVAGGSAAASYNNSDVMTMVWNEARYPTVVDSAVSDNLKALAEAARVVYTQADGKQIIPTLNTSDTAALAAFSNPWVLSSVNLQPTTQGSRLIYNTLVIILILIQEFFFLGYVNGLYQQFQLYTSLYPHRIAIVRQMISGTYTFIGSLCTTGAIWAFRHGWHVGGSQFVISWMALWLFAHLNFLVLDVFTIWLPPPYVPMALISWIAMNVTSILLPFELSPAFYRVGYALPAHSIFNVMIDIWSRGCNPQLYYALPVLFVYEVVGLILSTLGVYRRSHYAMIKKEVDEKSMQDRIEAMVLERQSQYHIDEPGQEEEIETSETDQEGGEAAPRQRRGTATTQPDEELMEMIRREISRPQAERVPTSRESTGPCFNLPFKEKE